MHSQEEQLTNERNQLIEENEFNFKGQEDQKRLVSSMDDEKHC